MDLDLVRWGDWEAFRDRCLTLLHEDEIYALYGFAIRSGS
jgi:hypothetical protein